MPLSSQHPRGCDNDRSRWRSPRFWLTATVVAFGFLVVVGGWYPVKDWLALPTSTAAVACTAIGLLIVVTGPAFLWPNPKQPGRATGAGQGRMPLKRLHTIALTQAGRIEAWLARRLGALIGRSTPLRILRAMPAPATDQTTVLGVDAFALLAQREVVRPSTRGTGCLCKGKRIRGRRAVLFDIRAARADSTLVLALPASSRTSPDLGGEPGVRRW